MKLVLTCEHGGNDIPDAYKKHFKNKANLQTHRALDLGALDLFETLEPLSDASYYSATSRMLVELNRSLHHKQLFSEFTTNLSNIEKDNIINSYYLPYRTTVENKIRDYIETNNAVLHLSIHSFTPKLNDKTRNCDIGLLFDSTKKTEQLFCKEFKGELQNQDSTLNVRFNYPYLGKADGFTTYLRTQFPTHYLGIEMEVNQKFASENHMNLRIKQSIFKTLNILKLFQHDF
ncbi:N-formylglutamate amidohydrolase [Winogradskyella ludwigii]|uniref:N-formylglutamate amidohydrolase n=1 Tax=Winogradskyella ludwigii TaxID=2686076 RepID=UPI0015C6ACE3|nr:N-formylglutamate amidohydrolase [Winogradskyella ludwigii]